MTVPFDYDATPERYRLGTRVTKAYAVRGLHDRVASILTDLQVGTVLDVGCAEGALREALPVPGPHLVGLDASMTLLRAHPHPVVQADATELPFAAEAFDAVAALNVLYHLPDPLLALQEARRVLRAGGHLLAATIARNDSPELTPYWTRPPTSFDAEDAPHLVARIFDAVEVHAWDEPMLTLPTPAAIRDYLVGRQAPAKAADKAARELPVPLPVTKRGALLLATKR